jgi:hypothetical protein
VHRGDRVARALTRTPVHTHASALTFNLEIEAFARARRGTTLVPFC